MHYLWNKGKAVQLFFFLEHAALMAQNMYVCVGTDNGGKKYGAFHIREALSKVLKWVKS